MTKGYVYILTNDHLDYVKIGKTTRSPEVRASELSNTSVPGKFYVAFSAFVDNCDEVEKRVHEDLSEYRVDDRREFFKVSPKIAKAVLAQYITEKYYVDTEGDMERNEKIKRKITINSITENLKNIHPILASGAEKLAREFNNVEYIRVEQRTQAQSSLYFCIHDEDINNIEITLDKYTFRINGENVNQDLFDNLHKVAHIMKDSISFVLSNIDNLAELLKSAQSAEELINYGDNSNENSIRLGSSLLLFDRLAEKMQRRMDVSKNTLNELISIIRKILSQSINSP